RWDESLFAGAARYYEQGRLPYAPELAGVFARSLALDGQGRLLDVGCGPGTVTLRLAPHSRALALRVLPWKEWVTGARDRDLAADWAHRRAAWLGCLACAREAADQGAGGIMGGLAEIPDRCDRDGGAGVVRRGRRADARRVPACRAGGGGGAGRHQPG